MSEQPANDLQKVSCLLSSLETADDKQDAVTAVVRQLSEQAANSGAGIGDFLWDVFNALFDVVGDTAPENQDALIDFIAKLRQEDVSDNNGQPVTYEGDRVWTDLPSFGWLVRDIWNFDASDDSLSALAIRKLQNQSSFLARLTAMSDPENARHFDFSTYGLWLLRSAFEDPIADGVDIAPLVRLAAPWILFAGDYLYTLSQEQQPLLGNSGAPGRLHADKQWNGFCPERWVVWKQGFENVEGKLSVAESKDLAKRAASFMQQATDPSS